MQHDLHWRLFPDLWRIPHHEHLQVAIGQLYILHDSDWLYFSTGHIPLVPPKIGTVGEVTGSKVKIVYLLTIAGRASRQVHRLVKQIYSPHHYILVHVDSR